MKEAEMDFAARVFIAGQRSQEFGLNGKDMLGAFVGCVLENKPETDEFQQVRQMARSLVKARKEATGGSGS